MESPHSVFSHEIYDYMFANALNDKQMRLWWHGMGNYCKPTRAAGQWLSAMHDKPRAEELKSVFASEQGHEETLTIMAKYLIARCEVRNDLAAQLLQQKRRITRPLRTVIQLLAKRKSTNPADTSYNIGTMLGIERLANQSIIPGEVKAFVDSRHYHALLSDTEMHYLDEHYGDLGAESWHQATLEKISEIVGQRNEVVIAEQAIYKATQEFYVQMLAGLKVLT